MPESPPITPPRPGLLSFFRQSGLPSVLARLCLYLALVEGITYVLRVIARPFVDTAFSFTSPRFLMIVEVMAMAGTFAAAWILSRLEQRHFGDYGLPLERGMAKLFAQGALFGIAEISLVLGVLAALGCYHFGSVEIHGNALFRWAMVWGVFFTVVGLYEEFAFRGYVQFTLAQGVGFWQAAVLLSVLFGAVHRSNPGETPAGLAGIVLTGLFWSLTLRRTGSLWFAVGMHASFDFGETFLYSVPDSGEIFPGHLSSATLSGPVWLTGGSAGPEASVFDFLVILAFFFIFDRLYPSAAKAAKLPRESKSLVDQV
jgi:uncharacterized protein